MRDTIDILADRPMGPALRNGWSQKCPKCGAGKLFSSYLVVRDDCDFCGQEFSHHRADDAPSWLTIIIVGHLIAPVLLATYKFFDLPSWAHMIIWPSLAMVGIILLLPRVKGAVIAFQWSKRMHGFDDQPLD